MTTLQLHISGPVLRCECRAERDGRPVVMVELGQEDGQTVRARHRYPDNSFTSSYAARRMCDQLKGQHVHLDAINPIFRAKRIDCEATTFVYDSRLSTTRKDLE